MPRITSIEPQKRKQNRFNIFLEGQFAFGISSFSLLQNNLKVGKNLTDNEIAKIISTGELSKLVDIAFKFLSFRPRSEKEVVDYLIKKISTSQHINYSQAKESILINRVLTKLKKYSYINDYEFAKWWLASRVATKKGPRIVKFELIKKGVDKEIINSVLENFPNQEELAKLVIRRKIHNWQKLNSKELYKKIYQYLLGKGFDFETAKNVFAHFTKKR